MRISKMKHIGIILSLQNAERNTFFLLAVGKIRVVLLKVFHAQGHFYGTMTELEVTKNRNFRNCSSQIELLQYVCKIKRPKLINKIISLYIENSNLQAILHSLSYHYGMKNKFL